MKYFTIPPLGTPLNPAHPLNRELVGYWPMGEGGGIRAQDLSGKGNHGTLTNMVQGSTSGWTGGKFGRAMRFDGTDDYLTIADNDNLSFTDGIRDIPFSISFWARPTVFSIDRWVFDKRNNVTGSNEYQVTLGPGGLISLGLFSEAGVSAVFNSVSTIALILNAWSHITFTYNGLGSSGITIYINGVLVPKTIGIFGGTYVKMNNGVSPLRIGDRNWTAGVAAYAGLLSEIKIYRRMLTAMEVQQLYTDPFCMYEQKNNFRWFNTFDRKGSFFFSRL